MQIQGSKDVQRKSQRHTSSSLSSEQTHGYSLDYVHTTSGPEGPRASSFVTQRTPLEGQPNAHGHIWAFPGSPQSHPRPLYRRDTVRTHTQDTKPPRSSPSRGAPSPGAHRQLPPQIRSRAQDRFRFRPESESASKSHASQNVRRGRRSVGAAACPCSRTDSNTSVSTSTLHICVNAEACGCAGLARLQCADTWAHARARALAHTHSHPKLPPGWRKPLRIGQQSRHSRPGGRETSQSCFLFFFPPLLPTVSFNGKTTAEL
nr:uncharacterized protein LOC112129934 [Pongo abelii]